MEELSAIIKDLKDLEDNVLAIQRKIKRLYMELEERELNNNDVYVYKEVINECFCIKKDPSHYIRQSDIFSTIKFCLKNNPELFAKCVNLGWKDSSPSNSFYRKFWKYISSISGINRVVKSKNDIRFYGLSVKRLVVNNNYK